MSHTETDTIARIQSVEVVTGNPRVAVRLIGLSKQGDVDLEDYSTLIESDAGLASRMLALVNSAWFAPETPIHSIKRAVCTLGLSQVRTVALSHCVASLHKSMKLDGEDSRAMWAGSMCKAIAARKYCKALHELHASEAFAIALLQDLGLALFRSMDSGVVTRLIADDEIEGEEASALEIATFGMTHADAGARLADHLVLPEPYAAEIANHHSVCGVDRAKPLASASFIAALLPHDIRCWSQRDQARLREIIESHTDCWSSLEEFMEGVQQEFTELNEQLNEGGSAPDLMQLLADAAEENARSAGLLVAQNSALMSGVDQLNEAVALAEHAQELAESRADKDALTNLFNRNGWDRRAKLALRQARSMQCSVGMAFFDLDLFKQINDVHGHQAGDEFLAEIGERIKESVRTDDVVCRWGGDEFVILFRGTSTQDCVNAAKRVKTHIESEPVHCSGQTLSVSTSCGFAVMDTSECSMDLPALLQLADESLYQAKEQERGSFVQATAA